MNRREFVKSSILAGAVCASGHPFSNLAWGDVYSLSGTHEAMRAFIVSDAHFGWRHPRQPSNNRISQAIGNIMRRFPNLDVFIDSGDIHHSNAFDQGRVDWTQTIAGGIGTLPLLLTPGNHEIANFGNAEGEDPEKRTMAIGSINCRPYYSFDMKGIHIVSLPQLQMVNLITEESLRWLELDMRVNSDKTTIIITHNSLEDTTLTHDSKVYRRVANSGQVFKFMDRYPNIVAWMHGHNHTWELVKKHGRFYVSNGRIGGFSPPYKGNFGAGHLGGIYFELSDNKFMVRGYSATQNCFFDEIPGYEHMSQTMDIKTSFDPSAPCATSWGMGGMRNGQKLPAYQHFITGPKEKARLYVTGVDSPVFSENSDLSFLAEQTEGWSRARAISGLNIAPKKDVEGELDGIVFLESAVKVLPIDDKGTARSIYSPQGGASKTYYRCVPGGKYKAAIKAKAQNKGPDCTLFFHVYDNSGQMVHSNRSETKKINSSQTLIEASFDVPLNGFNTGIYNNPESDEQLNLLVEASLGSLTSPVVVEELSLMEAAGGKVSADIKVSTAGESYKAAGVVDEKTIRDFAINGPLEGREVITAESGGNGLATWLVKQDNLTFQVRNAPAKVHPDGMIEIGPFRNRFETNREVILAPLSKPNGPYIHRMRGITKCRIESYDTKKRELVVHVDEVEGKYQELQLRNVPGSFGKLENVGHRCYLGSNKTAGVEVKGKGKVLISF